MQLQVNRGEGRHQVARRLFFANQGAFQTGDYEEIMNKATCLSLLSNAALVWNTVQMSRIIEQLRASGETFTNEELARISPLAFSHIIPNGTYFSQRPPGEQDGERNGHRSPVSAGSVSDHMHILSKAMHNLLTGDEPLGKPLLTGGKHSLMPPAIEKGDH